MAGENLSGGPLLGVTGTQWNLDLRHRCRKNGITHYCAPSFGNHGWEVQSMNTNDAIFQRALQKISNEIFDGPPANEAYLLNPGDQGLLRQLEAIDAHAASTRPMPGKTTIAAHVDHVHYGLTLMNRWAAGEPNPWSDADWDASWKRTTVSDDKWRSLRDNLRREAETWRGHVAKRTEWNDMSAAGALSSAAHTAYHLGAIRQIIAALEAGPG
jgi:hypothetical protein